MLRTLPFMGLFMFVLAIAFYFINYSADIWAQWLALISMGLYLAFFALGMGATPYAVNAEIYPLPLRATANSLAITSHWISNYIVAAAFLSAIQSNLGSVRDHYRIDSNLCVSRTMLSAWNSLHLQVFARNKRKTSA